MRFNPLNRIGRIHSQNQGLGSSLISVGPFITGQSLGALRSDFAGLVGFTFTTGEKALTVFSLGRWVVAGNTAAHLIGIYDNSGSGVPLAAVSVATAGAKAADYAYVAIGTPLVLVPATKYFCMSTEVIGGDQWYDTVPVTTTGDAALVNNAFSTAGIPTEGGSGPNFSYVPPNFLYHL